MGGSGGMMVLDDTVCIVQSTYIIAKINHDESCGRCSPCREGTGWMEKILHRIEHGEGRPGDVDLLLHMGTNIFGRTICPLGDAAVWPVESAIKKFRAELESPYSQESILCRGQCRFCEKVSGEAFSPPLPSYLLRLLFQCCLFSIASQFSGR